MIAWCMLLFGAWQQRNFAGRTFVSCGVLCSMPVILHGNGRLKDDVTIVKGNSYRHIFDVMSSLRG